MKPRKSRQTRGLGPIPVGGAEYVIPRADHCISRADISRNAINVLYRLHRAGFSAYLVGGGVRDLLLRQAPKDFDIATDARPPQVNKLFRNCRLIGRRFRLAHILFGREIIEVATFRGAPAERTDHHQHSDSGMILRDNVYGTLQEDVWRRDFTINALYYDIADFSIIDYCGGMADIRNKVIRLIGDPSERYQEDPVRMLRAVRFAAKLDFTIEEKTAAPIKQLASTLSLVPESRLFEELLKLFHSGQAEKTYYLLQSYDLMSPLLPSLDTIKDEQKKTIQQALITTMLSNTDDRIRQKKPVTPAFLFVGFLWFPLLQQAALLQEEGEAPLPALEQAMQAVLSKQVKSISIPRRLTQVVREVWLLQYRLPRRYGRRPFHVLRHPRFRAAYDFLLLRASVGDAPKELAEWWTDFQTVDEEKQMAMISALKMKKRPRKKKKKT